MYTFTKVAIKNWQSKRSIIPPCPGIISPKSLILNARLKPDAKNPPNGPITELKMLIDSECRRNGYIVIVLLAPNNAM
uniref:Uncharacterized protein n=1 Tax=Anopheles triannulatus TaxID=58253 RepID=A0A2M4ANW0_9DIPT